MTARSQRYREAAAELRHLADQVRWAESRDHLLRTAEHLTEMAEQTRDQIGATTSAQIGPFWGPGR